jgi:anti-sigma regulatory factor (Ser/Thr protein kinase)
MDHLRMVWQTGETLLESIPFQDDAEGTRYNVLVALQEMVTNVYRHAYGGDDRRPLVVTFAADNDGFMVTLRDQGPAFDPRTVTPPACGEGLPATGGGFGIMIARAVMDALDYQRVDGCNVVTMRKGVTARRPAASPSLA